MGAIRLGSTQIRWFSWWPGRWLDLMIRGHIYSRESWKTALESLGIQSEKWHSDSLKKIQLNLSRCKRRREMKLLMMRWWCSVSLDWVTEIQCSDELLINTQYIYVALPAYQNRSTMRGEGGYRWSTWHIQRAQLGFTSPRWTSLQVTRFLIILGFSVQLFCDWGSR
jgi:hypothetical protein